MSWVAEHVGGQAVVCVGGATMRSGKNVEGIWRWKIRRSWNRCLGTSHQWYWFRLHMWKYHLCVNLVDRTNSQGILAILSPRMSSCNYYKKSNLRSEIPSHVSVERLWWSGKPTWGECTGGTHCNARLFENFNRQLNMTITKIIIYRHSMVIIIA